MMDDLGLWRRLLLRLRFDASMASSQSNTRVDGAVLDPLPTTAQSSCSSKALLTPLEIVVGRHEIVVKKVTTSKRPLAWSARCSLHA